MGSLACQNLGVGCPPATLKVVQELSWLHRLNREPLLNLRRTVQYAAITGKEDIIIGDIHATEKVLLLASANMDGSLNTPRLSIEDGVVFNGTIEMKKSTMS